MADWQTPKTDWGVEPFGPRDFNRIEGNIAALESGKVMPRGVLLRAVPSDTVILEANTQRGVSGSSGTTLVKEFALKYPGVYRFKCEVRRIGLGGGERSVTVSVSGGSGGSASISTYNWQPINLDIIAGVYGSVVRVTLRVTRDDAEGVQIRNVKICGTLTMAEPEYVVLLD